MGKSLLVFGLVLLLFFAGVSSASATISPAKIVGAFFSNAFSALAKWIWSLKVTTKTVSGRSMMKFESGYTVETVFDGSKLGIEPYSVELSPNGELLILDSANSNLYKIAASLSLYSRPKLIAGSAEGYSGHVDGKPRDTRMNHPKGVAVDDKGNIYIADANNMAIRKISDAGVTTIAGGKGGRGGHVDGPSEEAKFSNDFDVVYVGSSCSLLIIDRGNQAIREIQLHFDDCAYQYGSGFPIGIAILVAAGLFGYMLALLQSREPGSTKTSIPPSPYQKPPKPLRPPLIPSEDEVEKQEEGFFASIAKLFANAGATMAEILGAAFSWSRKRPPTPRHQYQNQQPHYLIQQKSPWPVQESYVIPDEDEPPSIETRTPTPRKTYPFMSRDAEKIHQLRQSRAFYSNWDGNLQQKQQQHHYRQSSSSPYTYYEQGGERTDEILFGAIQEQGGQREAVIRPVDYAGSLYDRRPQIGSYR